MLHCGSHERTHTQTCTIYFSQTRMCLNSALILLKNVHISKVCCVPVQSLHTCRVTNSISHAYAYTHAFTYTQTHAHTLELHILNVMPLSSLRRTHTHTHTYACSCTSHVRLFNRTIHGARALVRHMVAPPSVPSVATYLLQTLLPAAVR